MDDELPIVIYIVLMCNIPHVYAELSFVEDFVKLDVNIENE